MAEYITKQEAIRAVDRAVELYTSEFQQVKDEINSLKSEDVAPVKRGEWRKVYSNKVATVYECSNCEHITLGASEYCICGAYMWKE